MNRFRVNIDRAISLTSMLICLAVISSSRSHSSPKQKAIVSSLSVHSLNIVDKSGKIRMMLGIDKHGNVAIMTAGKNGFTSNSGKYGLILTTSRDGSSILSLDGKSGSISAITPSIKSSTLSYKPHIIVTSSHITEDLVK